MPDGRVGVTEEEDAVAEGNDAVDVRKEAQDEYIDMPLRFGTSFGRADGTPAYELAKHRRRRRPRPMVLSWDSSTS